MQAEGEPTNYTSRHTATAAPEASRTNDGKGAHGNQTAGTRLAAMLVLREHVTITR